MSAHHPAALPEALLTETRPARIAEYKKRKQPYEIKRISSFELDPYIEKGWQLDRELKRGVRIRRTKSVDEQLENQFWIFALSFGIRETKCREAISR